MTSNTDRESAGYQLDVPAEQVAKLDAKGKKSAEKRAKTFTPEKNKTFIGPVDIALMEDASKASEERRKHITEQPVDHFSKK
ncbi:uncharacterized protein N7479_000091 [Penicillium vulpinum]|uniref:Uncharacterized protein n=1 Tax=Penicillium vulpinum TaxID=29845 RepID=A0A1V6RX95_9EURO|nr:uncharacterized protein N7479_000091 [Penicillium vulpinum]KAJ5970173.1 hypothetical protein N7479_000091 [Penicillium vulpinum]OQE06150.1 hypothetical protein PENVUL_c019G03700 [Penicillium vulpinum]